MGDMLIFVVFFVVIISKFMLQWLWFLFIFLIKKTISTLCDRFYTPTFTNLVSYFKNFESIEVVYCTGSA